MSRINVLAYLFACLTSLALVHPLSADESETESEVTEETFEIYEEDGC